MRHRQLWRSCASATSRLAGSTCAVGGETTRPFPVKKNKNSTLRRILTPFASLSGLYPQKSRLPYGLKFVLFC
jgi:hypothetical protein